MTILNETKPSLEELEHHGVKGMRWGFRRDRTTGASLESVRARTDHPYAKLRTPKEQARAEAKAGGRTAKPAKPAKPAKLSSQQVAAERNAFYQAKADRILQTAMADKTALIALRTQHEAVIVTGKQFVDYMSRGGLMDIRATDVWATQPHPNAQYVLNPNVNQPFVPSDKKK